MGVESNYEHRRSRKAWENLDVQELPDRHDYFVADQFRRNTSHGMTLPAKAEHVQNVLSAFGMNSQVIQLSESARTAREAAFALNCRLGQIVKSLVFRVKQAPILVLVSGINRVDEHFLQDLIGHPIKRARADFVRQHTGYAIGGVAPVGHPQPIPTFIDIDLLNYEQVWAAAGGPDTVFACPSAFLATLGKVVRITPAED